MTFELVADVDGQFAVFTAQLIERNHGLGLAANVEECVFGADLDDFALDQFTDVWIALGDSARFSERSDASKSSAKTHHLQLRCCRGGFHAEVAVLGLGLSEIVPGTAGGGLRMGEEAPSLPNRKFREVVCPNGSSVKCWLCCWF